MSILGTIRNIFSRQVEVVKPPSPGVTTSPGIWSQSWMGPGRPIQPIMTYGQDVEPRTMDYNPQVNAIVTTRTGYALTAFTELKAHIDNTPEAATYRRLIIDEMSMLIPQLKDASGEIAHLPEFEWMTTKPDGRHDWQIWLAKWLDSIINYDAGALFRVKLGSTTYKIERGRAMPIADLTGLKKTDYVHTGGRTVGLRVIDGSTIFPIITENGDEPLSPLPAFAQIIKGMPFMWLTRDQLWYHPRHERSNAPYGIASVEDCWTACEVLQNYWDWLAKWYTWGTSTDDEKTAPPDWTEDQVLRWQQARADLLRGNPAARQETQYFPDGFKQLSSKGTGAGVGQQREKDYISARNTVALAFGIPPSERGDAPSEGFGGKSWHEGGTDAFARQVLLPLMAYIASPFNDILWNEYGYPPNQLYFELSFPAATVDPEEEENKTLARWEKRLITRNEARENIKLPAREGPDGDEYFEPSAQMPVEEEGGGMSSLLSQFGQKIPIANNDTVTIAGNGHNGKVKVVGKLGKQLQLKRLTKAQRLFFKHCGVCADDDAYFGAPVSRSVTVSFPSFVSNELEIVSIADEKLGDRAAIWRPESGEKKSHREWVGGSLYPREEAVYLLDRAMELYLVPVAFVTELDSEMGVVVHYVKGREAARYADRYDEDWVDKAGLLDYISGQTDRHAGNWLTHPDDDGRPILVDNALSFIDEKLERPTKSPFADILLSKPLLDDIKDLLYLIINNHALWEDLAELVGPEIAEQAKTRAVRLYEAQETESEAEVSSL